MATGQEDAAGHPAWFAATAAVTGAAVWLFTRPYVGVIHDSRLYTLMALAWAQPQRFAGDLFLAYGSQDSFSVFSPIYGFLIAHLGLAAAYPLLLLIGGALWLTGTWALLHTLLDARVAKVTFVLMAGLPLPYGGWGALVLGENFLTARLFAEGFVLLGLAAALRRRHVLAVLALLAAGALHPLMALPGAALALLVAIPRPRTRLLVAAACCVTAAGLAVGLGLLGLKPFAGLLHRMDPTWLAEIRARNGFVFVSEWLVSDWAIMVVQAASAGAAALWATGRVRLFLVTVLAVAAGGLALALIGGDWLHDVFILQVQPWRSVWLLAWATPPALVALAVTAHRRRELVPPLALLVAGMLTYPSAPTFVVVALGWTLAFVRRTRPTFLAITNRLLVIAATGLSLASLAALAYVLAVYARQLLAVGVGPIPTLARSLPYHLVFTLVGAAVVAAGARRRYPAAVAATFLLLAAALAWDVRGNWDRFIMTGAGPDLPGRGAVLWGDDATNTWLLLRRPSYMSAIQAAGGVFSRTGALAWQRRFPSTHWIVLQGTWEHAVLPPRCDELEEVGSYDIVRKICRGSAGLDGVILDRRLGDHPEHSFRTPVPFVEFCKGHAGYATHGADQFYFYPCDVARGALSP